MSRGGRHRIRGQHRRAAGDVLRHRSQPEVDSPMTMRRLIAGVGAGIALAACTLNATPVNAADAAYDVLVFSKTAGFRHDAIPVGIQTIRDLGAAHNFTVTATEDAGAFTTGNLRRYEAVVFLSTTGEVLNNAQQAA